MQHRIRRNMAYSLMGGFLPAVTGVAATLVLVRVPDPASKVALLVAWTAVGFLNLTDLGLTRSASKLVSSGAATSEGAVAQLWRVAIPFGLGGVALLSAVAASVESQRILWFITPLPLAATLQFALIGALEAHGAFRYLALQRVANAIFTYLLPAILISWLSVPVELALSLITATRILLVVIMYRRLGLGRTLFTDLISPRASRRPTPRPVLLWLAVSSLVGPILLYVDRFVLGASAAETDVWIYYVAVSETMMKSYIVPTAVSAVVFPWLSSNARSRLPEVKKYFLGVLFICTIALAVLAYFVCLLAPDRVVLALGASPAWLPIARDILAVMVSATVVNWSTQLFIALLQAFDEQRFVAVAQLVIAVPYVGLLIAGAPGGPVIVAAVGGLRIAAVWLTAVIRSRHLILTEAMSPLPASQGSKVDGIDKNLVDGYL